MAQERKVYDFNSVGITSEEEESVVFPTPSNEFPIGIATPIRLSKNSGTVFEMHTSLSKQIKDNFKNLVSTNHGERLMLQDFGANLKPLAYELGSESGDTKAISRISRATSKYMPYIQLMTFESIREKSSDGSLSRMGVRVIFAVPSLGIPEQGLEVIIASAG